MSQNELNLESHQREEVLKSMINLSIRIDEFEGPHMRSIFDLQGWVTSEINEVLTATDSLNRREEIGDVIMLLFRKMVYRTHGTPDEILGKFHTSPTFLRYIGELSLSDLTYTFEKFRKRYSFLGIEDVRKFLDNIDDPVKKRHYIEILFKSNKFLLEGREYGSTLFKDSFPDLKDKDDAIIIEGSKNYMSSVFYSFGFNNSDIDDLLEFLCNNSLIVLIVFFIEEGLARNVSASNSILRLLLESKYTNFSLIKKFAYLSGIKDEYFISELVYAQEFDERMYLYIGELFYIYSILVNEEVGFNQKEAFSIACSHIQSVTIFHDDIGIPCNLKSWLQELNIEEIVKLGSEDKYKIANAIFVFLHRKKRDLGVYNENDRRINKLHGSVYYR